MKYLIAILLFINFIPAISQVKDLKIKINAPWAHSGEFVLKIGDIDTSIRVNFYGQGEITIQNPSEEFLSVRIIKYLEGRKPMKHTWSNKFELNGSGNVVLNCPSLGLGDSTSVCIVEQWPAITWKSNRETLDVYQNGNIKGSTIITRGVEPNTSHRFTWKIGDKTICDTFLTVPYNVKRTCTCSVENKQVIVQ